MQLTYSHASLLDISNIGNSEEDLDEDVSDYEDEEDVKPAVTRYHMSLQRGMSLPPETRSNTLPRGTRDTVSMSRDMSPSNMRHQRRRSGVYSKFGQELPSSLVSSFTKPKNQSPFTGTVNLYPACPVKLDMLHLLSSFISPDFLVSNIYK